MGTTNFVQQQLIYWAQITAAGAFTTQFGPGLMTIGVVGSVYTVTLPANYTVPLNRRFVSVTTDNPLATPGSSVTYDHFASAAGTVVFTGAAVGGGVLNTAFHFQVFRLEMLP
jgi:hypothetical protein